MVFDAKMSSPMQVIYHCAHLLREWSTLQKPEHRDPYMEVCSRLEQVMFLPNMGGSIDCGLTTSTIDVFNRFIYSRSAYEIVHLHPLFSVIGYVHL
jgi:hypothetical protein